jgi:hypothetical protein
MRIAQSTAIKARLNMKLKFGIRIRAVNNKFQAMRVSFSLLSGIFLIFPHWITSVSAYIRIETSTVERNAKLTSYNMRFTPDPDKILYHYEAMFYKVLTKHRQKITIWTMKNENDFEFSHKRTSFVFDTCKLSQGVLPTVIVRLLFNDKNYLDNIMKCPMMQNHWYRYNNLTFTDEPPVPVEVKFKYQLQIHGVVEGMKAWSLLSSVNMTGRVKKEVFKLN